MKLFSKVKFMAAVSAVLVFFAGCDTDVIFRSDKPETPSLSEETGFVIQLPGKIDRAAYWTPNDATSYTVELKKGQIIDTKSGEPGSTVKFIITEEGTYTIKVYAYRDTLLIAEGSNDCSITMGAGLVDVSVMLNPKEKGTELNVQIGWNTPYVPDPEPVTNYAGTVSGNLFANGDADGGTSEEENALSFNGEAGVIIETTDGGASGNCWKISQEGDMEWQEVYVDLTDFYGRGKSYLVSFKAKANTEDGSQSLGMPLNFYYNVYSGALESYAVANGYAFYDYDDRWPDIINPWFGTYLDESLSTTIPRSRENIESLTDEWVEYKFVIPATDIDRMVNNTGLYRVDIILSMGEHAEGGYSYLIDDFSIKDLNVELPRTGCTWIDPRD